LAEKEAGNRRSRHEPGDDGAAADCGARVMAVGKPAAAMFELLAATEFG